MERMKASNAATTPPQPPAQVQTGELGLSSSNSTPNVVTPTPVVNLTPGGGPHPPPSAHTTITPAPPLPPVSTVTRLNSFMSVNIDKEMRHKCLKLEFIELYDLVKKFSLESEPSDVTWYTDSNGSYTMRAKRAKQLTNINDWNLAMAIYSDILIDGQTDVNSCKMLTRGLIKYQQEIRDVAIQYPPVVWVSLDREYRARQANFPNERTWHTFEPDVYQKILNKAMLQTYGPHGAPMHYASGAPAQQAHTYTPKAPKPLKAIKPAKKPYAKPPPPGAPHGAPTLKTCMFFQQAKCKKGAGLCSYDHHCSICKSTGHGKFACPQNPRNSNHDQ